VIGHVNNEVHMKAIGDWFRFHRQGLTQSGTWLHNVLNPKYTLRALVSCSLCQVTKEQWILPDILVNGKNPNSSASRKAYLDANSPLTAEVRCNLWHPL